MGLAVVSKPACGKAAGECCGTEEGIRLLQEPIRSTCN